MWMPEDFDTARLRVRDWRAALGDPRARKRLERRLAAILTPRVLAPLPPELGLAADPDAIAAWVEDLATEAGVMTVEDDQLVGLLILASPSADELHVGYLFGEGAWGKGYASELVAGLVARAGEAAPGLRLVAGVNRGNPASIRVLEKSGFKLATGLSDAATAVFTR